MNGLVVALTGGGGPSNNFKQLRGKLTAFGNLDLAAFHKFD